MYMSVYTYTYMYIFYELMDLNIFDVLQFIATIILTDYSIHLVFDTKVYSFWSQSPYDNLCRRFILHFFFASGS